jgi:hypothetical protein
MTRLRLLVSATSFCCVALLSGCGIGTIDHSVSGTSALRGLVHGGQQPVAGAIIQLYTVGSAGNGSTATAMLTGTPITTAADGTFDITNRYTCGQNSLGQAINSPSNQVYIVATQGNPGLSPSTINNTALVMMTALGDCSKLPTATYVEINEITTAAAAWALAPFMTTSPVVGVTATNVGASATNVLGIENAFLDAALLADSSTGLPADLTSKPTLTVETPKLISLANALGACVNSDGTTGCALLFAAATPTGSLVGPADTLAAALNIVKHPGENVKAVFQAISARAPFDGGLSTWPNDWTMSLTVTGGGLKDPIALAVDEAGNVWVAGHNGPLSAFNPQGTPFNGSPYGVGKIDKSDGIAIDTNGDVWVTQYNTNFGANAGAVTKFLGVNSSPVGSVVTFNNYPGFFIDIYFPLAVAADTNGNMFVSNNGNSSATVLESNGSVYTNGDNISGAYLGAGDADAFPQSIALDTAHGYWMPDGDKYLYHISADGVLESSTQCCAGNWGVAADSYGDVWVANYLDYSFSEVAPDGTLLIHRSAVGGIAGPQYLAVDAGQNVWFSNYLGESITEIASNHGGTSAGVAISPTVGAHGDGGYGRDAQLSETGFIAPDPSGNLWVANEDIDTVTMFFGLATPTMTPIQPAPTAP